MGEQVNVHMKHLLAGTLIPGALALGGVVALVLWANVGPVGSLEARVPGLDRTKLADIEHEPKQLAGKLTTFDATVPKLPGNWPRFRGERFDGVAEPGVPLMRQWPAGGPKTLWSISLGEGHAGAAVWNSRVFVLDYDRAASADAVRCFALATGKELWRFTYPAAVKRNHGMSRTVPAISDKYLVALGPKCQVSCLDPMSGKAHWLVDLTRQFGATVPPWYAGQCPVIDGDRAIIATGGDSLLVALDCRSGRVVWKSPNPRAWTMTHSSIMPMELGGRRMFVYCGKGGVAGVAADDGSILWDTTEWKITIATVPSPVILPEGKIFLSGGYNSGAMILQLKRDNGKIVAQVLQKLGAAVFGSTQHTPILCEGHLYGVREKDKQLVCLDLDGRALWSSGSQHRFGLGSYIIADGLIYVMNDEGRLTLAEAVPKGYRQLAQAQVIEGNDSWGPMAMAGGRLIVRDLTHMVCLEVAK
jgi:outer membrane protein assembly factor BamB